MPINDHLKADFGKMFVIIAGGDHNEALRALASNIYWQNVGILDAAMQCGMPAPKIIVHEGNALPGGQAYSIDQDSDNTLHIAFDGMESTLPQALEEFYRTYEHRYDAPGGISIVDDPREVPEALEMIQGTYTDERKINRAGHRGLLQIDRGPTRKHRERNTKGDLLFYNGIMPEERNFWLRYMFSHMDNYSAKDFLLTLRVLNG